MKAFFRRWCRRALLLVLAAVVSLLLLFAVSEGWTHLRAHGHCSPAVEDCPQESVGLVLGCSKYILRGRQSPYFMGRMEAAERFWKSGRARCLIVSGDNRHHSYNEPRDMKAELIRRGVPEGAIICDFAGLCTYDSVVRAKRVFGAESLAIISQSGHAARAVTIARSLGMEAVGLEAPMLRQLDWRSTFRQWARERAARVAMLFDLLTRHQPHHLGEPIALPPSSSSLRS